MSRAYPRAMARILLGVSGGIAAYKALELARLATKAGHGVRVLMTPAAHKFVGRRIVRGDRRGTRPDRRVRARPDARRLPRRRRARARPDRPPGGCCERRRFHRRPGHREHRREARLGRRRFDAHDLVPGMHRAAAGRPGHERPHVCGCRDPGEPGHAARARSDRDRPGHRGAGLAWRVGGRAAARSRAAARGGRGGAPGADRRMGRPAGAGHSRRYPRADRPGALHRQPLERPDGSCRRRARPRARSARHAGRRERLAAGAGGRRADRRRDDRRVARRPCEPSSPAATCW